jgi:hypothetical protein
LKQDVRKTGEKLMKKALLAAVFVCFLTLSLLTWANAEITGNISVGEDLFVTFEFRGLDQTVYDQAKLQFTFEEIPDIIERNFANKNQTVGTRALPLESDDATRMIRNSFYIGGSAIVSFTVNKTTLKRVYEVKTDWRKIKVNLTDSYSFDFAQHAATPVAEWQKPNDTTFYYENKNTGALDVFFYLSLPASASQVRASGDTVFFEMPPYSEDILLGTPFLILIALAIALVIILLYRKVR